MTTLTDRQKRIFKTIVEEFIKTAEPVGSKTLVETYEIPYSSATIRNEMSYLEDQGLLEKTHTSSGRVPSTAGYRYYVENLMDVQLPDEQKCELQNVFTHNNVPLEDVIQRSCDILSQMTNLTTIVLGPDAEQQRLSHIRIFPLDSRSAVAVFITDKGHTENKTFKFNDEITVDDIENCTNILNDRLTGTPLAEVVDKMTEIKPILAHSVKQHEALFNAFMQAFIKFASDNMYYSGERNMLYQPEFADVEKLKGLMKMLEDSKLWRSLTASNDRLELKQGGGDEDVVWMDDMAVVSSKVQLGEQEGRLMVVGPSRMEYNKVVNMLNFAKTFIEKQYPDDKPKRKK